MNQIFVGGIALIIAFILWSTKKQSKSSPFIKFQKSSLLNQNTTNSFVQKNKLINQKETDNHKNFKSDPLVNPLSLNPVETYKKLTKLISSDPNDRLLAIKIASKWDNIKAIPFLRRGLKDSDSRVVIAAAAAISSYKGRKLHLKTKSQVSRPPRNVFLMR